MLFEKKSVTRIADELGMSWHTAKKKVDSLGVQTRTSSRTVLPNPREKVLRKYDIREEEFDYEAWQNAELQPDLIDTRSWSWFDWCNYFLDFKPFERQITEFELIESCPQSERVIYRRSGKTIKVNGPFILRKLCESVFEPLMPIYYFSGVEDNIYEVGYFIVENLIGNQKLLVNYGYLLKDKLSKGKKPRNTYTHITLHTSLTSSSYKAMNLYARFRGIQNASFCIIDDPIDSKEDNIKHYQMLTRKLIKTIFERLMPVLKDGNLSISGTRYAIDDIFIKLQEEYYGWAYTESKVLQKYNFVDGFTIPENIPRGKLKPSDIIVHNEEEWEVTDPVLWSNLQKDPKASAVQNVIFMYIQQGERGFSQEFMNHPLPLSSIIKLEFFQQIDKLPNHPTFYNWAIFFDDATGESINADDRALSLVAYDKRAHRFFLTDMLFFRDVGTKKRQKIIEFWQRAEQHYGISIALLIETVMNQMETYTALKEAGVPCRRINPRGRGDKEYRIMNNLLNFLEDGEVYMLRDIRQKNQLDRECMGFGTIHVNMLDSIDQNVFYLNRGYKKVHPDAFKLVKK